MKKELENEKGILFVYDSLRIGGCERVISVLAREFASRGIPVTILMIKKNKVEFEMPESVKIVSFEDYSAPDSLTLMGSVIYIKYKWSSFAAKFKQVFGGRKNYQENVYEARKGLWELYHRYCGFMRRCFKEHSRDLIISFMDNPNVATLLAARGLSNTVIISERNHPGRDNVQPHIKRYRNRLYPWADTIVFQTQEERDYYPEAVKKKGVIIENPVKEGLPKPYRGKRRKEIITFCRIDRQKNLPGLIRAFCLIKEQYPEYNLAIYGKGNQEQAIRDVIRENHLEERVFLRAYNSDVHKLVYDAAIYVSFSDYEGISNSMLEAMAMGMPVICTDCPAGGAREMIEHQKNGLLVPVGDEKAMARAMAELIDCPEKAERLGKMAEKINKRCSVENITDQWLKVLYGRDNK